MTKYPDIKVKLIGEDGNAFRVLGATIHALKTNGVSKDEIDKFTKLATDSDYDNLLGVVMEWVEVE